MEILHRTHNLRIAPRKLRLVADKIRYQEARNALGLLNLIPNKGGGLIHKALRSAVQMAKDHNIDPATLVIQRVWCDEGSSMKRAIGHSRGRMSPIMKKNSHLSLVLTGSELTSSRSRKPRIKATAQEPTTNADQLSPVEEGQ